MSNAKAATETPRKATLEERRAHWTNVYRESCISEEHAQSERDRAIVNMFRSLPDSVVTRKTTATGVTTTTKPVSDNQRAKDTLSALAVGIDESGATRDVWALKPQRVVQIVKAYRRAEDLTMLRPDEDGLSPLLATDEGRTLVTALQTAARPNNLGDAGADAFTVVAAKDLADVSVKDVVAKAEEVTREAISKAKEAKAEAKEEAKSKEEAKEEAPRPAAVVATALDSLESALSEVAKDLDPQQKSMLLHRLESLALHLK
jgi:hypothetical protein